MRKKLILFLSIALSFILVVTFVKAIDYSKASIINYQYYESSTDNIQPLNTDTYVQDVVDMTDFEKKITTNILELYSNKETGAIRILNKNTGYYWCSDAYNIDSIGEFPVPVKKKMISSFRMVYRNADGAAKEVCTSDTEAKITETVSGDSLIINVTTSKAKINFKYIITLNDNKFNVKVNYEDIKELDENKLTSLTLFPYLGSSYKETIPGYIFIPSGSGALIRYDSPSNITNAYTIPFYGTNANITKNEEGPVLSLPVYGVVHGEKQNAIFAEVKDGTGFATLTYSPSNIDNGFNLVYPTFNYRETYTYQIPGSEQVLMIPEDYYQSNIEIEYTVLGNENASYVGMAKSYQNDLVGRGVLTKQNNYDNVSLHIDTFGRDYEDGLIFKKYHNMTTTKDILNMNKQLSGLITGNIFYTLRAFNKGGYSNQKVSNIKWDNRLGSLKDLDDLETYFYYNPIESYNKKKTYPTNVLVNLYNEKNYIHIETNKYKFYANVSAVEKYTKKILSKYQNITIDGLGYILYGDKNNKLSREQALDLYSSLLGDEKMPLYKPNYYLLKNSSKYLNMPLAADKFRFVSDSVPFLSILLRGYIDCYSTYINFSSNVDNDVLKCIEYGINPAYLVTQEASYELSNSLSSNYFATTYANVLDMIVENYEFINKALSQVVNAEIISREVIATGIVAVGYSNGKEIIVNYSNEDYTYNSVIIPKQGYKVI